MLSRFSLLVITTVESLTRQLPTKNLRTTDFYEEPVLRHRSRNIAESPRDRIINYDQIWETPAVRVDLPYNPKNGVALHPLAAAALLPISSHLALRKRERQRHMDGMPTEG